MTKEKEGAWSKEYLFDPGSVSRAKWTKDLNEDKLECYLLNFV
jgi:hypothetical protein